MHFWFSQLRPLGQQRRRAMLGIPYRVHQLQRLRREQRRRPISEAQIRIILSESQLGGTPFLMQRVTGWSFGSKMMATTAGLILMSGVILTLLTMNSKMNVETYRPIVFVIFGVMFVIVGPLVLCRWCINTYRRDQRSLESTLFQRLRHAGQLQSDVSTSGLAETYGRGDSGRLSRSQRNAATMFPGSLPSYQSALDLKNCQHWATKFFRDPPPPYQEAIELQTISCDQTANEDLPEHSREDGTNTETAEGSTNTDLVISVQSNTDQPIRNEMQTQTE